MRRMGKKLKRKIYRGVIGVTPRPGGGRRGRAATWRRGRCQISFTSPHFTEVSVLELAIKICPELFIHIGALDEDDAWRSMELLLR
ncbi:hypothetical protein EVAR_23075_1 [Eumeta japonica]|uniref:Uncharacterized protein n=1 Tax=Eumeta variegata TaxID=151549 RepID=A0A4C1VMK0_EUMVA|nr:hypothetical protein EVAR_23075_1 [Eumeta japonica]